MMTTKWHTRFSNLSSPLLSPPFYSPFPYRWCFPSPPSLSQLYTDPPLISPMCLLSCLLPPHLSSTYFHPLSYLPLLPSLFPFFSVILLLPNHHNHQIRTAGCSAWQNETHLSQLNLYKTLNKSRGKQRKKAGKDGRKHNRNQGKQKKEKREIKRRMKSD